MGLKVAHFSLQDVFLMIRRHKTTIFTDAKESTTVYELKRIVEGILKRAPEDQRLYKVNRKVFNIIVHWCVYFDDVTAHLVQFFYSERRH